MTRARLVCWPSEAADRGLAGLVHIFRNGNADSGISLVVCCNLNDWEGLSGTETSAFYAMRWLMIALLVSLAAMLLAVAGVARHIWLERARLRSIPDTGPVPDVASRPRLDLSEEIDREI